MKRKSVSALTSLALVGSLAASLNSQASAPLSETEFTQSDFVGFRHFGAAVAIDGDTAVVGVPQDTQAGRDSGAAYVFVRTGTDWNQQAKLIAADAASSSKFGSAVAISADTVVVGAPFTSVGGVKSGAAYVFVRNGSTWTQQAKLAPTDAIGDDQFANSLAVEGDSIAIGAFQTGRLGVGFPSEGAVYIYTRSGTTWAHQVRLRSDAPGTGNWFGFSVALNNGRLAVGSPTDDDLLLPDAGAVYVFTGSGGSWNLETELTAADAAVANLLGWSVALSGDTLVAGAPQTGSAVTFAGAAYVFVRDAGAWSQQAKLVADDDAMSDYFGYSVAVQNNRAVIGSVFDDSFALNGGSAYFFTRAGNSWTQDSELSGSDVASNFRFGSAVALSGATILVGAPLGGFFQEGAAYLYELASINTAPEANSQSISTSEDSAVVIALTGSDAEADPLSFTILSNPTKGSLSGTPPNLSYTPHSNLNGPDSFSFKVNDGSLDSTPATVSIQITPVNDAPTIGAIPDQNIARNSTAGPIAFTVQDVDNDPASLVVSATSDNPAVVPVLDIVLGGSGADRTITLTPAANQSGTALITVTVSDGGGAASTTFVVTVVAPANHSPVADATATTVEIISANNTDALAILDGSRSSDPDNDSLTYSWFEGAHSVADGAVQALTLPVGTHTITLVVSDGPANDSTTVTVRVVTLAETIEKIIATVQAAGIPSGQRTELMVILRAASSSCARGNLIAGENQLQAFVNKVEALVGKRIDATAANRLIADAQNVTQIITGNTATNPPVLH